MVYYKLGLQCGLKFLTCQATPVDAVFLFSVSLVTVVSLQPFL